MDLVVPLQECLQAVSTGGFVQLALADGRFDDGVAVVVRALVIAEGVECTSQQMWFVFAGATEFVWRTRSCVAPMEEMKAGSATSSMRRTQMPPMRISREACIQL